MNTFRLIRQKDFFSCRSRLRMLLFNSFRVASVRGNIPFCMLLVISLIALSTLPFCICSTNFFGSCAMVSGASSCLRLLCIVSPSFKSSAKCPNVHNLSLLSRALIWSLAFSMVFSLWSLAFQSLLGFCSKRLGMIITAFNTILLAVTSYPFVD